MAKRFFGALLAIVPVALWAAPEVISTRPEPARIVRSIDRELCALFHFRGLPPGKKALRFTFDAEAKKKIARYESPRRIEYLVRDDGVWREDPEVFRRIVGAVFAYRSGMETEVDPPRFLLAGMRGELRELANARRINRANRQAVFLRALLASERTIDFSCAAPDDDFLPARIYQEEAGEALLYAAHRRGLLDPLKSDILRGGRTVEKLLLALDSAAKEESFPDADALLLSVARRLAWHEFSPRPAAVSRREFAKIRVRQIPELDLFGNPTGRTVPADIELFFQLLATRPDAETLRNRLVGDLRDFLYGEAPESRRCLRRIMPLVPGPESAEVLRNALRDAEKEWEKREKLERFLARCEIVSGGIGSHCPARLDAVRKKEEALSPRAAAFFDRIERLYSGE